MFIAFAHTTHTHDTRQPGLLPIAGTRYSSFRSSEPLSAVQLDQQPNVQYDRSAETWQHVQNLLAPPVVPTPTAKAAYTSGWQPPLPAAQLAQLPYHVPRTKNHMVPVYLETTFRGQRRVTRVRHCAGDIWLLERELRAAIEQRIGGKPLATRVHEMSGQIWIKGDYVELVRQFLVKQGL